MLLLLKDHLLFVVMVERSKIMGAPSHLSDDMRAYDLRFVDGRRTSCVKWTAEIADFVRQPVPMHAVRIRTVQICTAFALHVRAHLLYCKRTAQ